MKTVFMGASSLGYACCERLLTKGANIVKIFTVPKEFNIVYKKGDLKTVKNVNYADFDELGKKYGIPVIEVSTKLSDYEDLYLSLAPDFALAIGWYHMIPSSFLEVTPRGVAGIHGSLLPKYRGNAPLVWAMINGEEETGVSLFYFEKEVDSGDLIAQKKIPIVETDTISDLLEKAKLASVEILDENYPLLIANQITAVPQNHSEATEFPARSPKDGEIDWSWERRRIRDFIRAQTRPYPGAFTIINGKKVTIWDADVENV